MVVYRARSQHFGAYGAGPPFLSLATLYPFSIYFLNFVTSCTSSSLFSLLPRPFLFSTSKGPRGPRGGPLWRRPYGPFFIAFEEIPYWSCSRPCSLSQMTVNQIFALRSPASTNEDFISQLDSIISSTMNFVYRTRLQEMHLQLLLFDALDQYCNTYFYSKFEECPKSYKPSLSLSPGNQKM